MDNVPDSIYFKDRQSRFTRINLSAAARFGVASPALAVGRTDFDFFADEHAAQALRDEQEIIRTGQPMVNVEEKETRADGDVRWVSTTKLPLRDRLGNIIGTFGISRDITARKQVEEQLAAAGVLRSADRSAEPRAVPRPPPASLSPRQPRARQAAVRGAVPRPRPLQGGQRQPRPPGGRRAAGRHRAAARALRAAGRHARAPGRRRVHPAARGHQRARRTPPASPSGSTRS